MCDSPVKGEFPVFQAVLQSVTLDLYASRRVEECLPKISYLIQADGSLQQEELKESDSGWTRSVSSRAIEV